MLLIYSTSNTPRLAYMATELAAAIGIETKLTTDIAEFKLHPSARINYAAVPITDNEIHIAPVSLLFESNIHPQTISGFNYEGHFAFFKTEGNFPFDVLAAAFYLISRYEEYLPHTLDMYGRFAHENSTAFKNDFLQLPLVNSWFRQLQLEIAAKFLPTVFTPSAFQFIPTYDIDIAWSYLNKGYARNAGGLFKSLLKFKFAEAKERIEVLVGIAKDPFDIYGWLNELHLSKQLQPIYFFLLAQQNRGYDKNIPVANKNFQQLIRVQSDKYATGIHPSWQSGNDEKLLKQEINLLSQFANRKAYQSRQHYIRMKFPGTYRQLLEAGITEDYSMGYGSINGFRASYCLPFKWFDVEKNEVTTLTIFPFCYMEANSIFEQHFTADQALAEATHYYKAVKEVNGMMITVFHNHLITAQENRIKWRRMYQQLLDVLTSV